MSQVCPRSGRNPWRRKKNCFLGLLGMLFVITVIHMSQYNNGRYTSLQPLQDAESEARRLLMYITHLHYQCNTTFQLNNQSHWPLCVEREVGVDLEARQQNIVYSIGPEDYQMERVLALNHSCRVFIMSHTDIPRSVQETNNTTVKKVVVAPNDPSDYGRNSYGQHTLNDLMKTNQHQHVNILRLHHTAPDVQMWELVHYIVEDNLLLKFDQIHLALYIDKIEDDYLYNWYRVMFGLFHKEGFRLYHTSSSDSLCLQVTMMQSCMYYLSWIRNPGPRTFVMQPPADFGTQELEEERLLDHMLFPQTECHHLRTLGHHGDAVTFHSPEGLHIPVCGRSKHEVFKRPCAVFRFREGRDPRTEHDFITLGCTVHNLQPVTPVKQHPAGGVDEFVWSKASLSSKYRKAKRRRLSSDETLHLVAAQGQVALVELDAPGREWDILTWLLSSGATAVG